MKSLFNKTDNYALLERLYSLSANATPLWGKMSVAQMLAHCQQPLKVGFGELTLERTFIGILFGGWAKKKFMGEGGFGKNLPTDKSFIFKEDKNFEIEKAKLVQLIQRFATDGPNGLTDAIHPFFGKMTPDEWSILSWKHLDHHLTQFGV